MSSSAALDPELREREPGDLLLWCGPYHDWAVHLAGPAHPGAFSTAASVARLARMGAIDGGSYVRLLRGANGR